MKSHTFPTIIDYKPIFDAICAMAKNKDLVGLRSMVERGESISFQIHGISPVMSLALSGDEEAVYFLLHHFKGYVPLCDAAKAFAMAGDLINVKYCIEMGAPLPFVAEGAALMKQYQLMASIDGLKVEVGGEVNQKRILGLAQAGVGMDVLNAKLPFFRDDNIPEFYFDYKCFILRRYATGRHWDQFQALFTELLNEVNQPNVSRKEERTEFLFRSAIYGCASVNHQPGLAMLFQFLPHELKDNYEVTTFAMLFAFAREGRFEMLNTLLDSLPTLSISPTQKKKRFTSFRQGIRAVMHGLAIAGYYQLHDAYRCLTPLRSPWHIAADYAEVGHVMKAKSELGREPLSIFSLIGSGEFEFLHALPTTPFERIEIVRKIRDHGYFTPGAPLMAMLSRLNSPTLRRQLITETIGHTSDPDNLLEEAARLNKTMRKYDLNLPQARGMNQPDAINLLMTRNGFVRTTKVPMELFYILVSFILKVNNRDAKLLYTALIGKLYKEIMKSKKPTFQIGTFKTKHQLETEATLRTQHHNRLIYSDAMPEVRIPYAKLLPIKRR